VTLPVCLHSEFRWSDNWSYRTCVAPVKSLPPTNQIKSKNISSFTAFYRPDTFCHPANSVKLLFVFCKWITFIQVYYYYLHQGVFLPLLALSVSRVRKKVYGFWRIFGRIVCVTNNKWLYFGGDHDHAANLEIFLLLQDMSSSANFADNSRSC